MHVSVFNIMKHSFEIKVKNNTNIQNKQRSNTFVYVVASQRCRNLDSDN